MATLCKNCNHALVYDPDTRTLVCSFCGSSFMAEEVESESKKLRQDLKPVSANEVYGTKEEKYMDCYIYQCSECGGEIIVNDTEASTYCIYCGNPNVVFSRVAKQRCPEYILPFMISKKKALELVHREIDFGPYIPKEIKDLTVDCIRGIYIPYWIVSATYTDAVIVEGPKKNSQSETSMYGRAGRLTIKDFPIDASKTIPDALTARLEPFDLAKLRPFDEDYLAGFYSNVSDVTYGDLKDTVMRRAQTYFHKEAIADAGVLPIKDFETPILKDVVIEPDIKKYVKASKPHIKLDEDMVYAMLPVWFMTFRYEGKPYTILVNGDSGKVVYSIPWLKKKFFLQLAVYGFLMSLLFAAVIFLLPTPVPYFGVVPCVMFTAGIGLIIKVVRNVEAMQNKTVINFIKKRQG